MLAVFQTTEGMKRLISGGLCHTFLLQMFTEYSGGWCYRNQYNEQML